MARSVIGGAGSILRVPSKRSPRSSMMMPSPSAGLLFDSFSMTNAAIFDMQKRRTAYEGPCVRVGLAADSGATTLDIGFNPDGTFDWDAYDGFGTGSERVTIWYDQSGNGYDLSRTWHATLCPIVRLSPDTGTPSIFFNGTGSLGNSGYTAWNGALDCNIFTLVNGVAGQTVGFAGYHWTSGTDVHSGYNPFGGTAYWFVQGFSQYNTYTPNRRITPHIQRWYFDLGGASDVLQARYFLDGVEQAGTSAAAISTWPDATGLYINGQAAGTNADYLDWHGFYVLPRDLAAGEESAISTAYSTSPFTFDSYNLFCLGDSLTYGIGTASPPTDSDTYPAQLKTALESSTGKTWNLRPLSNTSESAAKTERVLQMNVTNGNTTYYYNAYRLDNIAIVWCGTNDFAIDGDTVADTLTGVMNTVNALDSYGFRVYVLNMLPRTDLGAGNAAFEVKRLEFNDDLAASVGSAGTVVDVASNANLDDSTDATYYAGDGVHLSPAGYTVVAGIVQAAIEADI